ncbi:PilZ domain-containing protein [Qipengyuania xiapuensis]|uniref:PilZ domain-containing protein n=1 Tax=Qipengyuania xiapuensis TaxID=2867236 RepID=A0ABX8ZWY6_9SPHN|nr:PilZ domain-containing protein [Qipengyuania xiapuensis]QZD92158.1 PilZ domain-containing protein [Qipengyuania xiapuensis]
MTFWKKDIAEDVAERRAERIIQRKRSKQDRSAKGLGAVAIPRRGARAIHQRNEDRHVLKGKKATADLEGDIFDVSLLNLSSNGVMIGSDRHLAIGDEITLSIEDCAPITTAVRWVRDGRIGLEFIAETVIIAEAGVRDFIMKTIRKEHEAASYSPKLAIGSERRDVAKRHQLVWVGKLKLGEKDATARLRNISRSGAMVSLSGNLDLDDDRDVILSLRHAGDLAGKVRWHAGQECGIEFADEFDVSLLVNESYAELEPEMERAAKRGDEGEEDSGPSDYDLLRVRHGNVENPHHAPDMEYKALTLEELYATLHPKGKAEDKTVEADEPAETDQA